MDFDALWGRYGGELDDFWDRRQNRTRFVCEFVIFDRPVRLESNHEGVLAAIEHSQPLYSVAAPVDAPPFSIQLVVHAGPADPGPPPETLFDHVDYAGAAAWLSIELGGWGHAFVDLDAGRAVAVLAPPLAARPDLVSRCLLDTVLTNFFIGSGYAMLHASCLVRGGRALLLLAPHNSGKSTTALRLALGGYRLLSDSMIFLPPDAEGVQLLGFPVGKVKLRADILAEFPTLRPLLAAEPVRDETKYSADLRRLDPDLVCEDAFRPAAIDLCLLALGRGAETRLTPAGRDEVEAAVMANSLFYDAQALWRRNLATIERLLVVARWHHLTIGDAAAGIVAAVKGLS